MQLLLTNFSSPQSNILTVISSGSGLLLFFRFSRMSFTFSMLGNCPFSFFLIFSSSSLKLSFSACSLYLTNLKPQPQKQHQLIPTLSFSSIKPLDILCQIIFSFHPFLFPHNFCAHHFISFFIFSSTIWFVFVFSSSSYNIFLYFSFYVFYYYFLAYHVLSGLNYI